MNFFLLLIFLSCRPDYGISDVPVEEERHPSLFQIDDTTKQEVIFRRKPIASKYWLYPPDITLCLSTGVSRQRFVESVRFWKSLGYTFETVEVDTSRDGCFRDARSGEILITLFDNQSHIGSNLAVTRVSFYTATSEILSARILMLPAYSNRRLVLEHEIGHALGWSHFNRNGHIMHSEYNFIGASSAGVRQSDYLEMIKGALLDIK